MDERGQSASRIVVGFDGSAVSRRALKWALRQADATSAVVEPVTAWDIPVGYGVGPAVLEGEDLAAAARKVLDEALDTVGAEYPGVVVEPRVLRGHPATILIDQAKDADLLVVGSHGHGGLVGALLGSVSQHCVQHATCPVVVIRGSF